MVTSWPVKRVPGSTTGVEVPLDVIESVEASKFGRLVEDARFEAAFGGAAAGVG